MMLIEIETLKFKDDPTRTLGIRKRWTAASNKRFRKLKGRINRIMIDGDEGLIVNFEYTSDSQSVTEFLLWLNAQVNELFYTNDATASTMYHNKYIDQAYLRGIKASKQQIRALGITADQLQGATVAEIAGVQAIALGVTATGLDLKTIHLDAIRLLYTREYSALKGVTDEMSKQIAAVLVEGIEQGLGARDIAKLINDRVDKIGRTRARLIARTETVRAYNIGSINQFAEISKEVGIEPMYKWLTAGDLRVRKTHVDRNGKIYTQAEAMKLIGEPNCRCTLKSHIEIDKEQAA